MKRSCQKFIITSVLFLSGCTLADVKVNVVSERTTLENQVLGSYNALSDEVLLVASVRGVEPSGTVKTAPRRSREYQNTVEAIETIAFHADDVELFKRLGWVGEDNQGFLISFSMDKGNVPAEWKNSADRFKEEEFSAIVKDVNGARKVVMQRVIDTNENLTKEDLPEIRKVFGKLNRENALPGDKIQNEDGSWTIKP
ncbi:MAG TPA: DUF1318 domain-containing protein [Deltaproteobacteria bacterium]|nr:DUF1318 domain-containing protein [Deltaproteobacteria bacterium]